MCMHVHVCACMYVCMCVCVCVCVCVCLFVCVAGIRLHAVMFGYYLSKQHIHICSDMARLDTPLHNDVLCVVMNVLCFMKQVLVICWDLQMPHVGLFGCFIVIGCANDMEVLSCMVGPQITKL